MSYILTNAEVAEALYLESDYDTARLTRYAAVASSFIKEKTGWDFAADAEREPLAIECAVQYVRQLHFGAGGYNREHDYTFGIVGLLVDLNTIAQRKIAAAVVAP